MKEREIIKLNDTEYSLNDFNSFEDLKAIRLQISEKALTDLQTHCKQNKIKLTKLIRQAVFEKILREQNNR